MNATLEKSSKVLERLRKRIQRALEKTVFENLEVRYICYSQQTQIDILDKEKEKVVLSLSFNEFLSLSDEARSSIGIGSSVSELKKPDVIAALWTYV